MIMNKKFSTLMALALMSGSAFAQLPLTGSNWQNVAPASQGAYRTFGTKSTTATGANISAALETATKLQTGGTWTKDVLTIDENQWYQLEVTPFGVAQAATPDVLIQERNNLTGEIYLRSVPQAAANTELAPLNASLWKIKYSKADGQSGGYFTYVNKETGLALTFDHSVVANDSITELRAGTAEWSWYTVGKTNNTAFNFERAFSYLHNQKYDQVMYLTYAVETDKAKSATVAELLTDLNNEGFKLATNTGKLIKAQVEDVAVAGSNLANLGNKVLTFKPVVAAPFFMSAEQFNTRMDADMKANADSFQFKMNKALKGADVFLNKYFRAEDNTAGAIKLVDSDLDITGNIQTLALDGQSFTASDKTLTPMAEMFNLKFKTAAGTYLLADTARYQEATHAPAVSPSVKFALKTPVETDNTFMKARYYYRATYFPTNDSILIEPLNAAVQSDKEWSDKTFWRESQATQSFALSHYSKANTLANNDHYNNSKTVSLTAATIPGETEEVLTVAKDNLGEFKIKTTIDRPFEYLNRATVETGLYFIQLANHNDRTRAKDMYLVKNMNGDMMYDTPAMNQRFDLMPATMWTVQQLGCKEMGAADSAKYVKIENREYPGISFIGQLYSKDGVTYRFINRSVGYRGGYEAGTGMLANNFLQVADSITFTKVTDAVAYTATHGYKMFSKDELNSGIENNYNIKLNNFMNDNLFVESSKDTMSFIDNSNAPVFYEIAEATWNTSAGAVENYFGSTLFTADTDTATADQSLTKLYRKAYVVKVKDNNLIDNNQLYIASVKSADGRYYYRAVKKSALNNVDKKLAYFYFKADQVRLNDDKTIADTCYVLIDINEPTTTPILATAPTADYELNVENGWRKVAVESGYKMGVLRDNDLNDKPNDVSSAFYTTHEVRPQYINIASDYNVKLNSNIKIYQQLAGKNYLFEDGKDHNKVELIQPINKDFHYLGLESRTMDVEKNAALYVDEVVNDYKLMQRYLLGVRVDSIPDGYICSDASRIHGYWDNKSAAEGDGEVHFEAYNGYTAGSFLVNLEDSISANTNMMDEADKYKFNNYTRLGFVEGVHMVIDGKDSLFVLQPGKTLNDLMTIKDNGTHAKYTKAGFVLDPAKLKDAKLVKGHDISGNLNTNHTFSLRKTNSYADGSFDATASEPFLIESKCPSVASFTGMWIKSENGIPVLAKHSTASGEHEGNGSSIAEQIGQSGVFYFGTTTDAATSNDEVTVSSVKVTANNGAVRVAGAEGKKVVVTNVLGQTIANTVITSDDATIAAPQGVVVVAVEGEAAVKAIVK